jgi:hypothetical protein
MPAWRYLAVGGLVVLATGGIAFAICRAAGAPHEWAIVLYSMAAAALMGGLVSDSWATLREAVYNSIWLLCSRWPVKGSSRCSMSGLGCGIRY